ncbi:MAG: glycosyltransferase [Candidatus Aminicenantes bacterium]|nr:glycosyltransferase [Candidatus Aminicenantes bacterium]
MKKRFNNILKGLKTKLSGSKRKEEGKTIAVCAAQVPFFKGGAEAHVKGLVENLKQRGYETELINIPYKWYPREQLLKSIQIWKMLDLTESNGKKIDMVISTKFPSYFVSHPRRILWLIHQYRQAYDLVGTPFSEFDPQKKKDREFRDQFIEMDTEVLKSYERIYTNAKNTGKRLKKFNKIDSIPLYHPPRLAGRYFCSAFGDYVLSVGRLDKLKRVDLLLKAIKHCDPEIKCQIAGTGPELIPLKQCARDLGISERIKFLGYVSDEELVKLYAECRMVYFAPRDEDYGYITLEAFLSKKPVITASDSGGPLEFVENQKNGIILQMPDEKELAQSIQKLFFDESKCRVMGEYGYQKVKHISWDHVIKTLIPGE